MQFTFKKHATKTIRRTFIKITQTLPTNMCQDTNFYFIFFRPTHVSRYKFLFYFNTLHNI